MESSGDEQSDEDDEDDDDWEEDGIEEDVSGEEEHDAPRPCSARAPLLLSTRQPGTAPAGGGQRATSGAAETWGYDA